jgi:hypothetical protein
MSPALPRRLLGEVAVKFDALHKREVVRGDSFIVDVHMNLPVLDQVQFCDAGGNALPHVVIPPASEQERLELRKLGVEVESLVGKGVKLFEL